MPFYDRMMLRKRYIIETINDMLKNTAQIVHSRHRSVSIFTMNLILPCEHIVSLTTSQRHYRDTVSKTPNSCHYSKAKQLPSAFCYYPLLMAWGGGVLTLLLYCIRHSVIPNWGISYLSGHW